MSKLLTNLHLFEGFLKDMWKIVIGQLHGGILEG